MAGELNETLKVWAQTDARVTRHPNILKLRAIKDILSSLLGLGARPSYSLLQELSRDKPEEWLKTACLAAVTSARNPFTPGMILSVNLVGAAEKAPEGERKKILSLQGSVDDLLLEIFKRLPQTVGGFDDLLFQILGRKGIDDGMEWLSAVFEPEGSMLNPSGQYGPLRMALRERKQMETFCTMPLVMDFLSRRFAWGLPDPWDTDGVLDDYSALIGLLGVELALYYPNLNSKKIGLELLQGTDDEEPSLTILPGVQFIVAGLLGRPYIYYEVPVMRMVLDFVVFLYMLAVFSTVVLLHEDGPVSTGESIFVLYIAVSGEN